MLGQFCALDGVGSLGGFSELVVSRGDFVFSPLPPPPRPRTSFGLVLTAYLHVVYSSDDVVRAGAMRLDRSVVQTFARFFGLRDSLYCTVERPHRAVI